MMAERHARGSEMLWSLVAWGAGVVVAVIVFFVDLRLEGIPTALILAAVAFVVVGFVLSRLLGPEPADEVTANPAPAARHYAPAPAPAPPPAPAAAPAAAPEPTERADLDRGPAPAAEGEASQGGISARVRAAARAAGEAARAAGVHGGGVPSPALGEGVPPRPEPEPVPPGPVPPEPVPVPPAPVPPGPVATDGGERPAGRDAPREGGPDDLKRIRGVGPKIESMLHANGIYHFEQIAGWGTAELAWIDANLEGFSGRAVREDWVGQARILAAGGETEHSQQVDRGEPT